MTREGRTQSSFVTFIAVSVRVRTHWTDKICFALPKFSINFVSFQIFNLSNVGALRHGKIFVNHKCQSHRNKSYRFARCSWERLHEISGVLGLLTVRYGDLYRFDRMCCLCILFSLRIQPPLIRSATAFRTCERRLYSQAT